MESEYRFELSADRTGFGYRDEEQLKRIEAAIYRIRARMRKGGPIVAIHVPNPRYMKAVA